MARMLPLLPPRTDRTASEASWTRTLCTVSSLRHRLLRGSCDLWVLSLQRDTAWGSEGVFCHISSRDYAESFAPLLTRTDWFVCRCLEVGPSSCCQALAGVPAGLPGTWCPPACCLRCSTCRRLGRLITPRAGSAKAKGRTAQVRELQLCSAEMTRPCILKWSLTWPETKSPWPRC